MNRNSTCTETPSPLFQQRSAPPLPPPPPLIASLLFVAKPITAKFFVNKCAFDVRRLVIRATHSYAFNLLTNFVRMLRKLAPLRWQHFVSHYAFPWSSPSCLLLPSRDCTTSNKLRLRYNYPRKTSDIGRWTQQCAGIIAILHSQRSKQSIICHTAREGIYRLRLITNYEVWQIDIIYMLRGRSWSRSRESRQPVDVRY